MRREEGASMVEGRMRTRLRGHMSGSYQLLPGCFPSAKMGMEDAGPGTQGLDDETSFGQTT